jgi:16S rRNA (adenine1518-N6/adenine1519-N6)-dimethyltransferase
MVKYNLIDKKEDIQLPKNSNIKRNIKNIIYKYRILPNKKLGQNFLVDQSILQHEIDYAKITKSDIVLEIGPGIGNLTELLAQRAKLVIAIEKDIRFKKCLSKLQKKYDNIDIIYGDALQIDFPDFDKLVSNLPFKIALPLTFKLLDYDFDLGILIYQKKLAKRICASVGQKGYSRLSVSINRNANATIFIFCSVLHKSELK